MQFINTKTFFVDTIPLWCGKWMTSDDRVITSFMERCLTNISIKYNQDALNLLHGIRLLNRISIKSLFAWWIYNLMMIWKGFVFCCDEFLIAPSTDYEWVNEVCRLQWQCLLFLFFVCISAAAALRSFQLVSFFFILNIKKSTGNSAWQMTFIWNFRV